MINNFEVLSPTTIWFGLGVSDRVGEACEYLQLNRILIVSDPFIVESGLIKKVTDVLDADEITYHVYSDFSASPEISKVEKAHNFMTSNNYEGVIGFGGGSSMDTAKAIALLVNNKPPISQYFGIEKVPNPSCPMIMIPTTAGTGSETSNACILKDDLTHIKSGICSRNLMADIAIVDPELTIGKPALLSAATGMDALTHAIEGFISNNANIYTRLLQKEAIRLISNNLRSAVWNGNNIEARYNVMLGSTYAGWGMATASTGATHALAYPVESKYNAAHGEVNAALLPSVMKYNAIGTLDKFKDIAEAMGENITGGTPREIALRAVESIEELASDLEIRKLSQIGVIEDDLKAFSRVAINNHRLMGFNPRKIDLDSCINIYRDAL